MAPTVVNQYFQYRCDRQARYLMLRPDAPVVLGIATTQTTSVGAWAEEGADYEGELIAVLAAQEAVLRLVVMII